MEDADLNELAEQIKRWGADLGFSRTTISDTDLGETESQLLKWLDQGFHGEMEYMSRHGTRRTRPGELVTETIRVITVSMDYLPESMHEAGKALESPDTGYISRYALGRDYHKVVRSRLQKLADRITETHGKFGYRAFCDSAPVMEKALAGKSGQGWMGKHTNILNRERGSWFFLGELYTNLPLPADPPVSAHCGSCTACIDICPTRAITAPYVLDARRCISYHTIELHGSIPEEFRELMGNRIYGCDDCQLVCPWNHYASVSVEPDFKARHGLDNTSLVELFCWDEEAFLRNTEGSAIRRIGYERWLRNIAVALGNAPWSGMIIKTLESRQGHPSEIVREHVDWALRQQSEKRPANK